jgi:hypothetical protein
MLKERNISMEMVNKAMTIPDKTEEREDGTKHYLKLFNMAPRRLMWINSSQMNVIFIPSA